MTRSFALALLVLTTCGPSYTPSMPLGGRSVAVAIADCVQPQRGWISLEITSFGWHVAESGEVTVRCGTIDAPNDAEQYKLNTNEVLLDPTKVTDSFSGRASSGHGLIHWLLNHGPRPEMGRFHVCSWAYNESPPPNCYPLAAAKNALMSPDLGGVTSWDGDSEALTIGGIPEYRVTETDREFIGWALKP